MRSLLIVEDDITFGMMLETWLSKKGFQVSSASNIARARKCIEKKKIDIILSDLRLPDGDGISLLKWIGDNGMQIPIIIMTSYADIQSAVQAMKLGANDYIAKPVNPEELLNKINEALSVPTEKKPIVTTGVTSPPRSTVYLEGDSEAAQKLYNYVALVAPTNMSVLINGASGTGKEYVARRIHELSNRKDKPFIPIDCGAIPKELAASEFFGHMKGSFTGALADKTGAFIEANGGTIFLDEIGNLGYEIQIQLLRALQERRIRPIGSNKEVEVDIRLISATNENLEQAIEKGNFREDLYHRINEFTLHIPALKERKEDILLFANLFLEHAKEEFHKDIKGFDDKASSTILEYHWPGNLRQMKNIIKRATLLAQGEYITTNDLDDELTATSTPTVTAPATNNLALHDENTEKEHILEVLKRTGYNKSKAAQLLNIDRKTLYNKIKLYGLDV
ncbi:sigma-54 dependent transcriptional regulator [Bacteroides sp. 519]|uniref:sigma-54-dependent transcriptional regulator n=1 Tax=Bacteroides sp. 519 TaxID=2302937 RepID=UPI0013D3837E|nr:sigma-54 dependent transcriptional regulator [Bacteroides sp. 519]NDV59897.1 sigma-54-dependent Fis family transcriptional regulator [Bacteroides sp. 519]